MRKAQTNRTLIAAVFCVGLATVGHPAVAGDDICDSRIATETERRTVLDIANGIVRPSRLAPDTFTYCARKSLVGRVRSASVDTMGKELEDGSRAYVQIGCVRWRNERHWKCNGLFRRTIRVSVAEPRGPGEFVVAINQFGKQTLEMDAASARELVARSFDVANNPPPDLRNCTDPDGAVVQDAPTQLTRDWNRGGDVQISKAADDRYTVSRTFVEMRFTKRENERAFPQCWDFVPQVLE